MTIHPTSRGQTLVWEDWRVGDAFGLSLVSGDPTQRYWATNMQVYDDGKLGPRPWMKRWVPTTGDLAAGEPDDVSAVEWIPLASNEKGGLFILADDYTSGGYRGFRYDWSGAWDRCGPQTSGTDNIPSGVSAVHPYNWRDAYVVSGSRIMTAGTYLSRTDIEAAESPITYPSSFAPTQYIRYRARAYVFGDATNPERVHYSVADNGYSFPNAADFFNVGASTSGQQVLGAYVLNDTLMLYTQLNNWYALTGASPRDGVLQDIGPLRRPYHPRSAVVHDQAIWFLSRGSLQGVTAITPAGQDLSFDYVRPDKYILRDVTFSYDSRFIITRALSSEIFDSIHLHYLITPANNIPPTPTYTGHHVIERINGSWVLSRPWCLSRWDTPAYSYGGVTEGNIASALFGETMVQDRALAYVVMAPLGSSTPEIFTRDICLNRPSRSDDIWSSDDELVPFTGASSGARGEVKLGIITSPTGGQVSIVRVIVEVTRWGSGGTLECRLRRTPAMSAASSLTVLQTPSTSGGLNFVSSAQGIDGRYVFSGSGSMWEEVCVELHNIKDVAIRRVIVEVEHEEFYVDEGAAV